MIYTNLGIKKKRYIILYKCPGPQILYLYEPVSDKTDRMYEKEL